MLIRNFVVDLTLNIRSLAMVKEKFFLRLLSISIYYCGVVKV